LLFLVKIRLGFRGDSINKDVFYIFIFSTLLAVFFNNCGQFIEKNKMTQEQSSFLESYPWPNQTTTLKKSDKIISPVLFDDVDSDFYEEAIFVSNSSSPTLASVQKPVIRVVNSGPFKEFFNIDSLITFPNPKVKMLLTDIDMNNSEKELIYLSEDSQFVIAIELNEANRGAEKLKIAVVEPIDRTKENAFSEKNLGTIKMIEVGQNIILIHPVNGISIESSLQKLDGGWSEWGDWTTRCSKSCGDGSLFRMRLCTSPAPRNGGTFCAGTAIESQSCKMRDCLVTDCNQYQIFNNGNCIADPNNPEPPTTGGVTGGFGAPPTKDGGPTEPGTCAQGKVWDPFFFRCFQPYPVNDIWLTYQERTWGGGDGNGYRIVNQTHRLSLSHPKAIGMSARETAGEYCRFQGHRDVISYQTATYVANPTNSNVYVLCNIATNGMYFGRGGCPVGNLLVSFNYKNINHSEGQTVTYLKAVVCRKDQ
jgi:hypothetical protein